MMLASPKIRVLATTLLTVVCAFLAAGCAAEQLGAAPLNDDLSGNGEATKPIASTQVAGRYNPDEGTYAPPGGADEAWLYQLAYRDVTVSADERFLLAMVPVPGPNAGFDAPGLVLAIHDLQEGATRLLPAHRNLRDIALSSDSKRAWLLREDGRWAAQINLEDGQQLAAINLGTSFARLSFSPNDEHLLAHNAPADDNERAVVAQTGGCEAVDGRDRCRVASVRVADGLVLDYALPSPAIDVTVAPGGAHWAVLLPGEGAGSDPKKPGKSAIWTLAMAQPEQAREVVAAKLVVSGCGTQLQWAGDGEVAVISAVGCKNGQAQLLAWPTGAQLAQLGGKGPVAVSRNGKTVTLAARAVQLKGQAEALEPAKTAKNLVLAATLAGATPTLHVLPWGDGPHLPRLAIDAAGKHIYAQGTKADGATPRFAMAKVTGKGFKPVVGGALHMDQATWSEDGQLLYVLSHGALYRIPAGLPVATHVNVPGSPELLALGQQSSRVVLGEADLPLFYLVDVPAGDKVQQLHLVAK